jgi:peptidoglycan/LPS O-acetylase OafA/YrhL
VTKTVKYDWIDMCRAVAILMVIAVHTALRVPNLSHSASSTLLAGQLGVQLFFVASAITLCISMRSRRGGEDRPLLNFYIRRYFRIAPLYYFGIVTYGLFYLARSQYRGLGVDDASDYNAVNVVANVFLLHGFFPPAVNSIVPGGWSIATEVMFYALFPPAFLYMERLRTRRTLVCGLLIAACGTVELLVGLFRSVWVTNNEFEYFTLLNQLPVFLIGILAYYKLRDGSFSRGGVLSVAMLAVAATAALWIWEPPMAFFFIPIASALVFSALALLASRFRGQFPDFLLVIGRRSYSIYVLHFLFVSAVHAALRNARLVAFPDANFVVQFALVVTLASAASYFTERIIEKRGIALGTRMISYFQRHEDPPEAPLDRLGAGRLGVLAAGHKR